MADSGNTNKPLEKENMCDMTQLRPGPGGQMQQAATQIETSDGRKDPPEKLSTSEYCGQLQGWMWQCYTSGLAMSPCYTSGLAMSPCYPSALPAPVWHPGATSITAPFWSTDFPNFDAQNWYNNPFGLPLPPYPAAIPTPSSPGQPAGSGPGSASAPAAQQNGPGGEYSIPSPLQRFLAELVDFFILFFIKATIILSIMHLSGMKDISKFAMHFIVEEIDEDTSMEELQKMMLVALVYRVLVCFYEIVCVWGAGGATPGKCLMGLIVVTCDSSVLVQPNRVLVVPATSVSLSASTIRALNKNFSIAFFFPAFITLLFFQHNRTVYDMVAGTMVVKRTGAR